MEVVGTVHVTREEGIEHDHDQKKKGLKLQPFFNNPV